MYVVYCATSPSGKNYVGITKRSLSIRRARHFADAGNGSEVRFHRAIRKHGRDAFRWSILAKTNDRKIVCRLEQFFILTLNSMDSSRGYNMTPGGDLPAPLSPEQADRKRAIVRQRNTSPSHIAACRSWHLGRKRSPETRARISAALRGKQGRPHSEDTKNKLKQLRATTAKPVVCIETQAEYASIKEAARCLGMSPSQIRKSIKTQARAGGITFARSNHDEVKCD